MSALVAVGSVLRGGGGSEKLFVALKETPCRKVKTLKQFITILSSVRYTAAGAVIL